VDLEAQHLVSAPMYLDIRARFLEQQVVAREAGQIRIWSGAARKSRCPLRQRQSTGGLDRISFRLAAASREVSAMGLLGPERETPGQSSGVPRHGPATISPVGCSGICTPSRNSGESSAR